MNIRLTSGGNFDMILLHRLAAMREAQINRIANQHLAPFVNGLNWPPFCFSKSARPRSRTNRADHKGRYVFEGTPMGFIPQLYVINGWCEDYDGKGYVCDDCGYPEGQGHASDCKKIAKIIECKICGDTGIASPSMENPGGDQCKCMNDRKDRGQHGI